MRFVFKIVHMCSKCKKERNLGDFRSGCKILKTCIKCRDSDKKSKEKTKCIHNKVKCRCRECCGSNLCIHDRQKYQCKVCGGVGICIHNRQKSNCKECGDPIDITIKNMISNSKKKDKKINNYDEPNFIDYPFIQHLILESNDKCYYCSCELQYAYYTNNLATIERLDNSLGHIKSNCVIACRTCNYAKVGSNPTI